jgi:hypothetical protein
MTSKGHSKKRHKIGIQECKLDDVRISLKPGGDNVAVEL